MEIESVAHWTLRATAALVGYIIVGSLFDPEAGQMTVEERVFPDTSTLFRPHTTYQNLLKTEDVETTWTTPTTYCCRHHRMFSHVLARTNKFARNGIVCAHMYVCVHQTTAIYYLYAHIKMYACPVCSRNVLLRVPHHHLRSSERPTYIRTGLGVS